MTSLTGVFIFFLLKAEPEVDLSFQGVPGCRREEQGQWGRAGGRAHGAAVTGLFTVMEGDPTYWGVSGEPEAMALRMFALKGTLCLGDRIQSGTRLVFSVCYISFPKV